MRIRLLARALWHHHRRASLIALAVGLALLAAPFAFVGGSDAPVAADPDLILGRVWFDHSPRDPREERKLWVWTSRGVGVYQQGTAYRFSVDFFAFERSDRRLAMTFLQDGERARTRFHVGSCDEPPFDLCLTLDDPPRGPRRYFSFSSMRAMEREAPWARELVERANVRP